MNRPKRDSKEFWVALDGVVSCQTVLATNSPSMWYAPEEKSTLTVDVHLFERRNDANEKAHKYLDRFEQMIYEKRKALVPRAIPIEY